MTLNVLYFFFWKLGFLFFIAFDYEDLNMIYNENFRAIERFSDVYFFISCMLFSFFVGIPVESINNKKVLTSSKIYVNNVSFITKSYLKSMFIPDLLSIIPFICEAIIGYDYIELNPAIYYLKAFRYIRALRTASKLLGFQKVILQQFSSL